VDAAARAALIKPIGSENQLQKLSQTKNNNKTVTSPINRKGQVKTDTNWVNNTANKFYDKQVNTSHNNMHSKSGMHWERNENVNTSNIAIYEQQGPPERSSYLQQPRR
jgi:Flp pilus assembly protein TadG